jgi:hypothetical protein
MNRSPEMREPCGDQQGSKSDEKESTIHQDMPYFFKAAV